MGKTGKIGLGIGITGGGVILVLFLVGILFISTVSPALALTVVPLDEIQKRNEEIMQVIRDSPNLSQQEKDRATELYEKQKSSGGSLDTSDNIELSEIYEKSQKGWGGCLIATATFGTELSPQVQMLRELRDTTLLQTNSGTSFMSGFNTFYYSFSPTIADWERQSPIFKEVVKIAITQLITSLSILNYVDVDSEAEVLVYGISLILLNVGMYIVAPLGIVLVLVRRK